MPLKLVPVTFKRLTQTLVNEQVFANVVPNNCALGDQKGEASPLRSFKQLNVLNHEDRGHPVTHHRGD